MANETIVQDRNWEILCTALRSKMEALGRPQGRRDPWPDELRAQAVEALVLAEASGIGVGSVAKRLGLHRARLYRWRLDVARTDGSTTAMTSLPGHLRLHIVRRSALLRRAVLEAEISQLNSIISRIDSRISPLDSEADAAPHVPWRVKAKKLVPAVRRAQNDAPNSRRRKYLLSLRNELRQITYDAIIEGSSIAEVARELRAPWIERTLDSLTSRPFPADARKRERDMLFDELSRAQKEEAVASASDATRAQSSWTEDALALRASLPNQRMRVYPASFIAEALSITVKAINSGAKVKHVARMLGVDHSSLGSWLARAKATVVLNRSHLSPATAAQSTSSAAPLTSD